VEISGLSAMSATRNFSIVNLALIGADIRVTLVPK